MSTSQKKISDNKSMELFGKTNSEMYDYLKNKYSTERWTNDMKDRLYMEGHDPDSTSAGIDSDSKELEKEMKDIEKSTASTTNEDGEAGLMAFISTLQKREAERVDMERLKHDPIIKRRQIEKEGEKCRNACIGHMLGNMYMDSLPLDDEYKNNHNVELRDSFDTYLAKKGGPVAYVKGACENAKSGSAILRKVLETADAEVLDYKSKMGFGVDSKSVDDIKFSIDDSLNQRLDRVTSEVDFNEISQAIRDNVTKAAVAEIERAKKEAEAQQELEDALAKNTEVTSEAAVKDMIEEVPDWKYEPSLFEAIMINRRNARDSESLTKDEFDEVFGESVQEYTKLSLSQALGLEKLNMYDTKKLAREYANK